jgi:hypothetical protein
VDSNNRAIGEKLCEENSKGNGRGLFEVLFYHLLISTSQQNLLCAWIAYWESPKEFVDTKSAEIIRNIYKTLNVN